MPASRYRLFDLTIESELELAGLAPSFDSQPDWSVNELSDDEAEGRGFRRFHTWKQESGQEVMAAARLGSAYLVDFPDLARFVIDFEARRVGARPARGCTDTTLAHLLVDQVFPRVVCHEGRLVLHASAIQLADHSAVAFAGVSGRGKSTLASAFFSAGHRLLSDDCVLLEERSGEVFLVPLYASMRLWADSADALLPGASRHRVHESRMAHYTNKKVLRPRDPPAPAPAPVRTLFLIEPPGPLAIEPAGGMAAIMGLVGAQFALDVTDEESVRRNFAAVQRVAGHFSVFRLTYPREYGLLNDVLAAVISAASRGHAGDSVQA